MLKKAFRVTKRHRKRLKRLTGVFALAVASSGLVAVPEVPAFEFSVEKPKSVAKTFASNLYDQISSSIDGSSDGQQTFQSGICDDHKPAFSDGRARFLDHHCVVGAKEPWDIGVMVNIEEQKIDNSFGIRAAAGLGFKF